MANILLGVPCSSGPAWSPATAVSIIQKASAKHKITVMAACGSWDNFNLLWATALNHAKAGEQDYFAMLHSDIEPVDYWIDTLADEMERLNCDIVTTVIPQKSADGLTSSGVGDLSDPWAPHRRFTMHEIWGPNAPDTFNEETLEYHDKYLLHNDGCMIANLKSPCWYRTEMRDGREHLICSFEWVRSIQVIDGQYCARGESEDWYFSRALNGVGARAYMTRKVALNHIGHFPFSNQCAWGSYHNDQDTRAKWEPVDDESGFPVAATNSIPQLQEVA